MRTLTLATALVALTASVGAQRQIRSFRPLSSFNIPNGVAEIVDDAHSGNVLVYTNSSNGSFGLVGIRDPQRPRLLADIAMPGEPTSVSVVGNIAVANVLVDAPSEGDPAPNFDPGALVVIDISDPRNPSILGSIDIG